MLLLLLHRMVFMEVIFSIMINQNVRLSGSCFAHCEHRSKKVKRTKKNKCMRWENRFHSMLIGSFRKKYPRVIFIKSQFEDSTVRCSHLNWLQFIITIWLFVIFILSPYSHPHRNLHRTFSLSLTLIRYEKTNINTSNSDKKGTNNKITAIQINEF